MNDTDAARATLIDQADRTADTIEATKGQARCEAHASIAQGICLMLRCMASMMKLDVERNRNAGRLRRRVAALVLSWTVTALISAGILILAASCMVGFQWTAILEKLLP